MESLHALDIQVDTCIKWRSWKNARYPSEQSVLKDSILESASYSEYHKPLEGMILAAKVP